MEDTQLDEAAAACPRSTGQLRDHVFSWWREARCQHSPKLFFRLERRSDWDAQIEATRRNHIASSDEGCDSATGVPSNAQHGTSVVSPLNRLKSSHWLPKPVLARALRVWSSMPSTIPILRPIRV